MKLVRIRLHPDKRATVCSHWGGATTQVALHLYAPQLLCLLIHPSEYAVVPEQVADKFARYLREVYDEVVTCIEPVLDTDSTPPEQGTFWGLPSDLTARLDDLAVTVAFRAIQRDMRAAQLEVLHIHVGVLPPHEQVATFLALLPDSDPLLEKYFLTRTNFQITAITAGRTSVQNSGMPEA